MVCFGTRPELIKLAPVLGALERSERLTPLAVSTGQHRQMLDQMLRVFAVEPDVDLDLMRPRQRLADLTARAIETLSEVVERNEPDAVLVQGDTTTAFCAALAGFYAGIPVGHVEAGLRTNDPRRPFPEEINRRLVAPIARWHFCPTARGVANLAREGVRAEAIRVTGNTVVDALLMTAERPLSDGDAALLPPRRAARRILVTLHRRETQGEAQRRLCRMLAEVADRADVEVVFPVHLSPAVRASVMTELDGRDDVHLIDPLEYHVFVHALRGADLVVTDSGGVQEEAPTFAVPVLVMRDVTERPEGVEAGCARVCGTEPERVRREIERLLDNPTAYAEMAHGANPYGDGKAAQRIVRALEHDLAGEGAGVGAEHGLVSDGLANRQTHPRERSQGVLS